LKIAAIDKMDSALLPHFSIDGGVRYIQMDVMAPEFVGSLARLVQADGRRTAILGMHLCGNLSLCAVEAFQSISLAEALVLSPCCLPRKADPTTPAELFVTKDASEQYRRWGEFLQAKLEADNVEVVANVCQDILSPKNFVLCAIKAQGWRASSPGSTGERVE
jgi:hypothetical protein